MGPGVVQGFDRTIDHGAPFILDAKRGVAGHVSDLPCPDTTFSRSFEKPGKRSWFNGDYSARAGFAEDRVFSGAGTFVQIYNRAELWRGVLRPYGGGEAGLRESD